MLKCLDKEPARRYSSAESLAEDLANWLAGRPISARPVGQTERAWRWCKRNPAVAGLAASVAVSLLLGAVVSASSPSRNVADESAPRPPRIGRNGHLRRAWCGRSIPDGDEPNHETLSEPEIAALWELVASIRINQSDFDFWKRPLVIH